MVVFLVATLAGASPMASWRMMFVVWLFATLYSKHWRSGGTKGKRESLVSASPGSWLRFLVVHLKPRIAAIKGKPITSASQS